MVAMMMMMMMTVNFVCHYKASNFQTTSLLGFYVIYIRIFAHRYQIFGVNLCPYLQHGLQRVQEETCITLKNIL